MIIAYPRTYLPDWVEALANGNPIYFGAVIETVLKDLSETGYDKYPLCR